MNIFTKVPGLVQQTSKLGSVLQRAFYGSSGRSSSGSTLSTTQMAEFLTLSLRERPAALRDMVECLLQVHKTQVDLWVGYEHENFRGRQYLWDMSDRGEYNCYDRWCAQADHISSVRAVKQDNNPARAQLFERAGYSGKKMELQDDIPNLMSRYSLNRVASIRVLGGAWVVYQEPNYRGPHYILEKRDYNNFSDWGSQNSTIGSMRRVRFN
ncbi:crystallin beta gamma X [Neolamprologus brichardi]|uniref:crystallin beta gamma X n=1 Tax=Neolamprologus brichardi TaxID=32507 RepID=UPI0003EC0AB3|nr:crystallin beta gamma X [Neolamprologus brichardi]